MGQPLFFEGGRQPAARIIRPPLAGEFHTCGLRSVFSDAHVVRKNDWNLFRVCGRESLRRFAPCAALGQPLAALLLYGCCIPLAGKSLRRWHLFSAREGRKCGGRWVGDGAPI